MAVLLRRVGFVTLFWGAPDFAAHPAAVIVDVADHGAFTDALDECRVVIAFLAVLHMPPTRLEGSSVSRYDKKPLYQIAHGNPEVGCSVRGTPAIGRRRRESRGEHLAIWPRDTISLEGVDRTVEAMASS